MRLLLVTNSLEVGGIESNIGRITQALIKRGHEVSIAARTSGLDRPTHAAGATVFALPMHSKSASDPWEASEWKSPLAFLRGAIALRKAISSGIDLIHVFSATAAITTWIALRLVSRSRRPPVVTSVMGLSLSPDEPHWKTRMRTRFTLVAANTLIVTSPAIGSSISALGVTVPNVFHASVVGVEIPEPSNRDTLSKLRDSLGLSPNEHVVLTVGALAPRKSHELFVEAAAHVLQQRSDTRFLIAGDGPSRQEISEEIHQRGLTSQVHLLGERHDVNDLMALCDIYVRPGIVEGFVGITVLEAQALHKPVISFDTLDVRPAIEHAVSGMLVPPSDTRTLANEILGLLNDPSRATAIGEAGYQHLRATFALDRVVDGLEAIYTTTLNQTSATG